MLFAYKHLVFWFIAEHVLYIIITANGNSDWWPSGSCAGYLLQPTLHIPTDIHLRIVLDLILKRKMCD
jgi:hypothetical protein